MPLRYFWTLSLGLALIPGCYLLHGRDGLDTDAGRLSGAPDAGTLPEHDAGPVDAGMPLPAEPDPDLGPDSRPSDYPGADDWDDPPDIGEGDPCCVLFDPVRVTSRSEGMSLEHRPPRIAWGPGLWGLLVTRYFLRADPELGHVGVLWQLDVDGVSLEDARSLTMPPVRSGAAPDSHSLRWAEGRWAVAVSGEGPGGPLREMHARFLDRELRPAGPWLSMGIASSAGLARLSHGDRWLGFGTSANILRVTPLSDLSAGPAIEHAASASTVRAVGLRSRAAVLLNQADERLPPNEVVVVGSGPEHALLGRVALGVPHSEEASMTSLRDLVVVATVQAGRVGVEVVDPFELAHVAGPRDIGTTGAAADTVRDIIDVAGSDKHGLAGICYGVPGGEPGDRVDSRIEFRLVGPDGVPRGRSVTIVSGPFRASSVNCTVGGGPLGFLVGWWDGSELWVRRVDPM